MKLVGALVRVVSVSGVFGESVVEAEFSKGGTVFFVSDPDNDNVRQQYDFLHEAVDAAVHLACGAEVARQ